jgi:uncharacterized membrane protein
MLGVEAVQEEQTALPQQAAQVALAVVVRVTAVLLERLELSTQVVAVAVVAMIQIDIQAVLVVLVLLLSLHHKRRHPQLDHQQ